MSDAKRGQHREETTEETHATSLGSMTLQSLQAKSSTQHHTDAQTLDPHSTEENSLSTHSGLIPEPSTLPPPTYTPGSSRDPMLGQFIRNFQIVSKLGSGGFGAVYRAEHTELQTSFAIKLLNLFQLDNPEVVERFRREARAIAQLEHPNIVQVHDFGWLEDVGYYLVMEYLEGPSLRSVLSTWDWEQALFPLPRVHRVMQQLCSSLFYIHQRGMIHRDLKPSNVILLDAPDATQRDQIKLIDFGIASLEGEASLTASGMCLGSPAYMSPEQAQGFSNQLDPRSDLYSLGILFYQMLTGSLPFLGRGLVEYVRLHTEEKIPSLRERCPQQKWHPRLEKFVQRALAKKPHKRPADAKAFWTLCEEALEAQASLCGTELPLPHLQTRPLGLAGEETDLFALAAETQVPLPPESSAPGMFLWISLLVISLMAGGLTGYFFFFRTPSSPNAQNAEAGASSQTSAPKVRFVIASIPRAKVWFGQREMGLTPHVAEGSPGQMLRFSLQTPDGNVQNFGWLLNADPLQRRTYQLSSSASIPALPRTLPSPPIPSPRSLGTSKRPSVRKRRIYRKRKVRRVRNLRKRRKSPKRGQKDVFGFEKDPI